MKFKVISQTRATECLNRHEFFPESAKDFRDKVKFFAKLNNVPSEKVGVAFEGSFWCPYGSGFHRVSYFGSLPYNYLDRGGSTLNASAGNKYINIEGLKYLPCLNAKDASDLRILAILTVIE
jgi:hypothetical protein